ncbi:hypothetical protein ACVXG9_16215 [Escherichia coli]
MARRHITGSNDCIKPQPIKRNQAIIKPGFYWIFNVAQAGFILTRHRRDTPQGTEFLLAGDGQRAVAGYACTARVRGVYSCRSGSPRSAYFAG